MGPPSYMCFVVDRNVVMRCLHVFTNQHSVRSQTNSVYLARIVCLGRNCVTSL